MNFEETKKNTLAYIHSMVDEGNLKMAREALVNLEISEAHQKDFLLFMNTADERERLAWKVQEQGKLETEIKNLNAQIFCFKKDGEIKDEAIKVHVDQKNKWTELYKELAIHRLTYWLTLAEDGAMRSTEGKSKRDKKLNEIFNLMWSCIQHERNEAAKIFQKWEKNVNCL